MSLMVLMPMACMDDLFTPLMTWLEMGQSERKSVRSGEMWVVHPLSSKNRDAEVEASWVQGEATGDMDMAEMLMVLVWSVRLTDAESSF